jgi:hypothetical protein
MLGSLEQLDQSLRIELGDMIVDLLNRAAFEAVQNALIWTLGRVGGRVPVYGPLNLVVPPSKACEWIDLLLRTGDLNGPGLQLTLMQLARKTGDRFRDIDQQTRTRILQRLSTVNISSHYLQLISDGGTLQAEESNLIFGESLPAGLRLV